MNKETFDKLLGQKVSVLIDNLAPSGRRESYVGELKESGEDYICLVLSQDYEKSSPVMAVYLKHKLILSIWLYQ